MNPYTFSNASAIVSSDRILYTPSGFARTSLLHLQEIGRLTALKQHRSKRSDLTSFLYFMVTDGEGSLTYAGEEYLLTPGSCIFIDCRKPYSHMTSREHLWSLNWCHFYGPAMSSIYEKYLERGGRCVFCPASGKPFSAVWQNLFSIAGSADHIRDMKINEGLSSLLTLLMAESWHPEETNGRAVKKRNVASVREYLDGNYASRITLDMLAEEFFINKYYMSRMFKEQYGISILTYLQNVRITHAKQMLRFSDKGLREIGIECGIGDLPYFSETFKKVEGVPPSMYREQWSV